MPCLLTHQPVDLVIVMLGTNDLKGRFGVGARHYAVAADARSCPWIDAGAHVRSSDTDGIHLNAPDHERLGVVVAHHARRLT